MTVYVHAGLPGSGKTLRILSIIEEILKTGKSYVYLFNFHLTEEGVTHLTALAEKNNVGFFLRPDRPADLHVQLERDPKTNYVTLKSLDIVDGATIFIDEAQEFFRTRGMSKDPPPPFITMLETHRHSGYNIHFITQNQAFLDKEIRRICGEYIQYSRLLNASYCRLEFFGGIKDNPIEQKQVKLKVERFRYPKHIYKLYTSAVQHNMGLRIPAVFRSLLWAILLLFGVIYLAYSSFSNIYNGNVGNLKGINEQNRIKEQNQASQTPLTSTTTPAPSQPLPNNQPAAPANRRAASPSQYSLGEGLPASLDLSRYVLYYSGYVRMGLSRHRVMLTLQSLDDGTCFTPDDFLLAQFGYMIHVRTTYIFLYNSKTKHKIIVPQTASPLCSDPYVESLAQSTDSEASASSNSTSVPVSTSTASSQSSRSDDASLRYDNPASFGRHPPKN